MVEALPWLARTPPTLNSVTADRTIPAVVTPPIIGVHAVTEEVSMKLPMTKDMKSNGDIFLLCTDEVLARPIYMVIVATTMLYSLAANWAFHGSLQYS
jgi:hypothetical protein